MFSRFAVSVFIFLATLGTVSAQDSILPGKLAVYYGYPSLVNGANGNLNAAATVFSNYDIVVFGNSLQFPQSYSDHPEQNHYAGCDQNSHYDHNNTVGIIARLNNVGTKVYGYISIGGENTASLCGPLSIDEIKEHVDDWAAMGVAGIFLDEAEYGFGCSRERQNKVVDYVHRKRLSVFINAWNPDEVFGAYRVGKIIYTTGELNGRLSTIAMNPKGTKAHLGGNDIYLLESYQIVTGNYEDPEVWWTRSDSTLNYKNKFGTHVATVTTPTVSKEFDSIIDQDKFDYAWWSTFLYGFDYMGWGEANGFSSWGPYANTLLDHTRPNPGDIGDNIIPFEILHSGNFHTRTTTKGTIAIDSDSHTGEYTPAE